jgi:hypothetical protein
MQAPPRTSRACSETRPHLTQDSHTPSAVR